MDHPSGFTRGRSGNRIHLPLSPFKLSTLYICIKVLSQHRKLLDSLGSPLRPNQELPIAGTHANQLLAQKPADVFREVIFLKGPFMDSFGFMFSMFLVHCWITID